MSMVLTDIAYNLKMFFRNKMVMFWIFAFPVILFLLFGYLLGGQQGPITVYYIDHDGSAASKAFLGSLNATGAVNLVDGSGMDLPQFRQRSDNERICKWRFRRIGTGILR